MSDSLQPGTITDLLNQQRAGDDSARDKLVRRVYDELKIIARARFGAADHLDLQPTAIVHDACRVLLEHESLDAENRRHFFFLITRKMTDIFNDHLRRLHAAKRGGGWTRLPLVDLHADDDSLSASALELKEALELLESTDPACHEVVMLRFFGGRSLAETAELTGRSLHEVRKDWDYARAWLRERLAPHIA